MQKPRSSLQCRKQVAAESVKLPDSQRAQHLVREGSTAPVRVCLSSKTPHPCSAVAEYQRTTPSTSNAGKTEVMIKLKWVHFHQGACDEHILKTARKSPP